MTRLEKLLMRIELIDKVTAPANKIMRSVDTMIDRVKTGFESVATGAAGLLGTGFALNQLTQDAREMNRALGEVRSLSVAEDALAKLERRSLSFSIRYGESATEFVRSAYDIQSAIAGLVNSELAAFTDASNVLAKGTKADAATITNYLGTMYGIFKQNADAMGKTAWVEQLAGQTATAVEMFKTTGAEMSRAFTSLGADAQAHGVAINEQMAVLGKLQATMSGSEAGTKYRAFLRGVGVAQEKLGLQFTDSAGRMLPVDEILTKLQGKFGAIDTVAKSDLLKKAFGSDEAVAAIKLLINDTDGLTDAIDALGRVNGMDKARMMAAAMVDPLDRISAANTAVQISFGKMINQAMLPFYDTVIDGLGTLNRWINLFPNLAGALAKVLLLIFAFTAAVSALAIVKGLYLIALTGMTTGLALLRVTMIPFGPLLAALRMGWLMLKIQMLAGAGLLPALRLAFLAFNTQLLINLKSLWLVRGATWLMTSTMSLLRAAVLATAISFPGLLTGLLTLKASFIAAGAGAWAFTVALLANPITWIVLGVVALVAGLVLLVKHWDTVSLAVREFFSTVMARWQAFRAVIENNGFLRVVFAPLLVGVDIVTTVLRALARIPAWFSQFKTWLASSNIFQPLRAGVAFITDAWNRLRERLENNAFMRVVFTPLLVGVDIVTHVLRVLARIPAWFGQFNTWLAGTDLFQSFRAGVALITDVWNRFRERLENNAFLRLVFTPLLVGVDIAHTVLNAFAQFPAWFAAFKNWLADLNPLQSFSDGLAWLSERWTAFRTLLEDNRFLHFLFTPLLAAVEGVGVLLTALSRIPTWFAQFKAWLSSLSPFDVIGEGVDWLIEKLNLIPGVNISKTSVPELTEQTARIDTTANLQFADIPPVPDITADVAFGRVPTVPGVEVSPVAAERPESRIDAAVSEQRDGLKAPPATIARQVPQGGLRDQISNTSNTRSVHVEKLEVNTSQPVNGYSLADELTMAGA